MPLTNFLVTSIIELAPKVGFFSMHAYLRDSYTCYFIEIYVVTYRSIACLLEYDF